jgi:hypothetical protein
MASTKRFGNMRRVFAVAIVLAGLSSVAYLCKNKAPYAAEPTAELPVTCVPDRAVAHPGEKIAITVWIGSTPDRTVKDIKWTSSVGKITGNSAAIWTFPNDDTKVSAEAPATARARIRHASLGAGECLLQIYFVRRVGLRGESGPALLSGRTFLLTGKKEPEGYGLYSYILFGAPPTNDIERERFLKGLESYLMVVQPIEELEFYRDPHELNITLIPLKAPIDLNRNVAESKQARELASKLLGIYDYARAQVLLVEFGLDPTSNGPVLVSKRQLTAPTQADRTVFDMSRVAPTLISQWTKAFCNLATQESSWTEATLRIFALNVRNIIAVAANITAPPQGPTKLQVQR